MAEALYRKYRPRIFEDVVGQEHIERTIKNAIAQDKVSHAYLFCGPRGTGKTTTARLLAKALLCEKGPTAEPDGTCEDCEMIAAGTHPDVYELDAASRTGVENVREEIIGRVQFAPTRGDHKVYIIDEVHMLSTAAFNALLKTLEEPPGHVVFILCTTDPQKVPDTIHSRCQRFDFRRISNEAIVSRLGAICMEEGVEFEGDALELVAQRAEGGMRNALTSLEQLIAFGEGKVTLGCAERMLGALDTSDLAEIVHALGTRDVAKAFRWTADYIETGADLAQFTRDLAEHVRTMYVLSLAGGGSDVAVEVPETVRRELAEEMPLFGPDRLARMMGVLGDLSAELRVSTNPRLSFEIALTRMVRPDSDLTLEALAERIERLEQGAPVRTASFPEPARSERAQVVSQGSSVEPASMPEPEPAPAPEPVREPGPATIREAVPVDHAAVASASEHSSDAKAATGQRPKATTLADEQPARPVADAEPAASAVQDAPEVPNEQATSIPSRIQQDLQNVAALQRLWQAVLSALKQEKAAYGVLFLNTKAVYDAQGQRLTIEFPAESDFAFAAASKPDASEELARSIRKVCGASIPFALTKGVSGRGGAASQAVSAGAAAIDPASSNPTAATTSRSSGAAVSQEQAQKTAPASQRTSAASATEPVQGRNAQPVQAARTASAHDARAIADDPYYDEVPLDAYGDMAYASEGFDDAPKAAAEKSVDTVPTAEPGDAIPSRQEEDATHASTPASEPEPTPTPVPDRTVDAVTMPTPEEPSATELDAALASAFGEGMVFTEVDD